MERVGSREVASIVCAGRILLYAVDIDLNLIGVRISHSNDMMPGSVVDDACSLHRKTVIV